MNWFERHLHWTYVLSWVLAYGIVVVFGLIMEKGIITNEPFTLMSFLIPQFIILGVTMWILRRKQRSLWWVLMAASPIIGWVVILTIKNKR